MPSSSGMGKKFVLPSAETIEQVKRYAEERGMHVQIPSPTRGERAYRKSEVLVRHLSDLSRVSQPGPGTNYCFKGN
jgi:hypothetical protein